MNKKSPTFQERREGLEAIASDAEVIGTDLGKYATILLEHARVLGREAEQMKKAEQRFAERGRTQKASPEQTRPLTT